MGGKIGKSFIRQNNIANYCNIIGVIDRNDRINEVEGIKRFSINQIGEIKYDYIVITVLGEIDSLIEEIKSFSNKGLIIVPDELDYSDIIWNKESIYVDWIIPKHLELRNNLDLNGSLEDYLESKQYFNLMNVHKYLLDDTTTIKDLLITSIKDDRKLFWIKKECMVIGCVDLNDKETILNVENSNTVIDILKKTKNHVCISDSLFNCLRKVSYIDDEEVLLISEKNEIKGVIRKNELYSLCCNLIESETAPIISRGYCDSWHHFMFWDEYRKGVNSQCGEDTIIEEIFNRIGFESRYAVEFGAWDGIFLSNIKHFIDKYSFRGLFIEGNSQRAEEGIIKNYENVKDRVHYAVGYVQHRRDKRLDDFLDEDNAPVNIDFMSIDIDGLDYHVWKTLERHRARVVCIEYNQYSSNGVVIIPPLDEEQSYGASPRALVELGERKGYQLAAVTEYNLIFVLNEDYVKLKLPNNNLNAMMKKGNDFDNTWYQSFDGKIFNTSKCNSFELLNKNFASNRFCVVDE